MGLGPHQYKKKKKDETSISCGKIETRIEA
jgi:hypothetical protein